MKRVLATAVVLLAGCGQGAGPASHPNPAATQASSSVTPTASSSAGSANVLLAVAEGNQGCFGLSCASQVAIVGVDGRLYARATFTPPKPAVVGCEGSYVTNPIQVAAGAVYYLDNTGLVRRLSPSGIITEVAHFPIHTSQQLMWLAVSPDGSKLMAAIMVYPPLSPSWDPSKTCPVHDPGRTHEELDIAMLGRPTSTLSDKTDPPGPMSLGDWDAAGPVAIPDTRIAYVGYIDGTKWSGPATHLDAQGKPSGLPIGGADCQPLFGETSDGHLVCYDRKQPTVRDSPGHILWKLKALDPNDEFTYGAVALSPDSSHVAFRLNSQCCFTFDSSVVRSRDGIRIGLGSSFDPQGWLDNQTVIGARGSVQPTCSGCPPDFKPTSLGILTLANPTKVRDLGISGKFLGVIQVGSAL
jgi:hypothetical protein